MIGMIPDVIPALRCNGCRWWEEHMPMRDPEDEDWGFGECRRSPPVLVSSLVGMQVELPQWGRQTDMEVGVLDLTRATRFPVTTATDWCGKFAPKGEK